MTDSQNAFERSAQLAGSDAAADLRLAAAVAKCRVAGSEALRLEELAMRRAVTGGNLDLAVRSAVGSAELIIRFSGMFDDPPPPERAHLMLEHAKPSAAHDQSAEFILAATEAAADPKRDLAELEEFVGRALRRGEPLRASSLLEAVAVRHIQERRPIEAVDACRRRLDIFGEWVSGPEEGLESKDALHTAILVAISAGRLTEAIQLAAHHARLPFLRDEPDLALEEGIAPNALAGNWNDVIVAGHAFMAGCERTGRLTAPGRGLAPAALAMVHGIRGDDDERAVWLDMYDAVRGGDRSRPPAGYAAIFEAIVDLHHGRNDEALHHLARHESHDFLGTLFRQWHAVLAAEATVLAGHADAGARIDDATAAAQDNPIATALARRARTLHLGITERLAHIAADLNSLGCSYQAARTLSFADGAAAERGPDVGR